MHPSASYYEECLSTLQFANRCRNVVNNPRVNYVGEDDSDAKIKRLNQEIAMLRMKLGGGGIVMGPDGHPVQASALPPGVIADILQKFGVDAVVNESGELVVDDGHVHPRDAHVQRDRAGGADDLLVHLVHLALHRVHLDVGERARREVEDAHAHVVVPGG